MNTIITVFPNLTAYHLEHLRKLIVKRKNKLKRNYAKNRDKTRNGNKEYYVMSDLHL